MRCQPADGVTCHSFMKALHINSKLERRHQNHVERTPFSQFLFPRKALLLSAPDLRCKMYIEASVIESWTIPRERTFPRRETFVSVAGALYARSSVRWEHVDEGQGVRGRRPRSGEIKDELGRRIERCRSMRSRRRCCAAIRSRLSGRSWSSIPVLAVLHRAVKCFPAKPFLLGAPGYWLFRAVDYDSRSDMRVRCRKKENETELVLTRLAVPYRSDIARPRCIPSSGRPLSIATVDGEPSFGSRNERPRRRRPPTLADARTLDVDACPTTGAGGRASS